MAHNLLPTPKSLKVPSTKTWLVLASLLTTLLVAERQAQRPSVLAGRPAAATQRVALATPVRATLAPAAAL